jgi:hypothetical protein
VAKRKLVINISKNSSSKKVVICTAQISDERGFWSSGSAAHVYTRVPEAWIQSPPPSLYALFFILKDNFSKIFPNQFLAGLHKVHPAYRMVNAGRAGVRL